MLSDIEISLQNKNLPILKVAKKIGVNKKHLELYGNDIAKIDMDSIAAKSSQGKLILVTAISPTKFGEGKSTVAIGLADALSALGKSACVTLREPSLGPVFGIKGGACGGGYSQIVPMDKINLHFTGDMHAITSANNLLSAIIDNHIFQGNQLNIKEVYFKRCLDVNDRALKSVEIFGGRKDKFTITSASEMMAILTLATDLQDLKRRLGNIIVGKDGDDKLIYASDLKAQDAMAILLKDAIKPNLVQTLEHTPAIVHCGPFANIAHGCNSIRATKFALSHSDYVVTEAGFGADLGAEKFIDLKCQVNGISPDSVVLVVTIKALKFHGGANIDEINKENMSALNNGLANLERHIDNIKQVHNLPVVVAINKFNFDTEQEIEVVKRFAKSKNVEVAVTTAFSDGSKGACDLANKVIKLCNSNTQVKFAYDLADNIETKIEKVATRIYHAGKVKYSAEAKSKLKEIKGTQYDKFPVVIAKTQYSFSDDKGKINAPTDFDITIKDIQVMGGAEFIVAIAGNMLLMPGLAKNSAYENMTIDENGKIEGLF